VKLDSMATVNIYIESKIKIECLKINTLKSLHLRSTALL
jgi:hypothetical protein